MAAGDALRVLVADRPGPAQRALAAVVSSATDVVVVGVVSDGRLMDLAVRQLRPDLVVVDDRLMDEWRGPRDAGVRLIVVGVDDTPAYARRAARAHAVAWLPKERAGELLDDELERVRRLRTPPVSAPATGAA